MPENVEKVIKQEDTRLLRVRAVVGTFRSEVFDYDRAELIVTNPVEVVSEDGESLGWASVYLDGMRVIADMVLDYATPERLSYENGESLYAQAQGTMDFNVLDFEQRGTLDFSGRPYRVRVLDVTVLKVVVTAKPTDDSLDPIGRIL